MTGEHSRAWAEEGGRNSVVKLGAKSLPIKNVWDQSSVQGRASFYILLEVGPHPHSVAPQWLCLGIPWEKYINTYACLFPLFEFIWSHSYPRHRDFILFFFIDFLEKERESG